MAEYEVSVHYDEGTILYIEAATPEQAQAKAVKILSDEASVDYPKKYAPNVVHRDYMVVDCEEWLGG
tara:strand:- start:189 stop:389 length:201 start_codon:yes stop_codon:yes gene_type:complete